MTNPFDDLSPRAAWFMENFDVFGLAEIAANHEAAAVTFQTRIDAARAWARQHLTPEQQAGLLGVLRGDQPKEQV